jgi:hypothetical protein
MVRTASSAIVNDAAIFAGTTPDIACRRRLSTEDLREGRAPDLGGGPLADRLTALRGPGESYSDVILRLAKTETDPRPNGVREVLARRVFDRVAPDGRVGLERRFCKVKRMVRPDFDREACEFERVRGPGSVRRLSEEQEAVEDGFGDCGAPLFRCVVDAGSKASPPEARSIWVGAIPKRPREQRVEALAVAWDGRFRVVDQGLQDRLVGEAIDKLSG